MTRADSIIAYGALGWFAAWLLLAPWAIGGQTRLPPEYKARFQETIACLGAPVREPRIKFRRTFECTESGRRECMSGDWLGGASLPWENRVELPDETSSWFEHELVHDWLWHQYPNDDATWRDHARPEFARCGALR